MNLKTKNVILITSLLLLFFSGCTDISNDENHFNKNIISWEIIDCDKKSEQFIYNWTDNITGEFHSKISSSITNVSLLIKNNGTQEFSIKVDFEFILQEIIKNEDNEALIITSNKCSCNKINLSNNKSKFYSKTISLKPGDSKNIFASIDLSSIYGYKVIKWCYEVNLI